MKYVFLQNGLYWWIIYCTDICIHSKIDDESSNFDLLYVCTSAIQLAQSHHKLFQTESNELPFSSEYEYIEYNSLENLFEKHLIDVI